MRKAWRSLTFAILSTCFVLLLTACGLVVNDPSLFGGAAAVSITLSGPATVMLGGQSQYAATVTGSSDSTVAWSVNGVAGGNPAVGSITAKGLYVAPVSAPQSSKVTITATSVATPSVSKSLPIALATPSSPAGESVTLMLNGAASVVLGTSSQYIATVTGSADTGVTWSVNGAVGGNTTVGSISTSGLYVAPASAPQPSVVTITATSMADPSVSESLAVMLASPQIPQGGSTVSLALSGATTVTLGTTSQYAAVVTGTTNIGVIWSVDGVVGGDTTVGTISARGSYSAPENQPRSSKITIMATSIADPSVSESLAVTLASGPQPPPPVTLALSGATTVTLGTSSQYAAAVSGTTNTGVIWSVNGVVGGYTAAGTISANGRYAAPANKPQSSKVTITATSVADPTVSQNLIVTLASPPPPPPPPTVTLALSGATTVTLGTTSQYAAIVSGTTNTGVTWSVNGVVGGYTAAGTISANGRYAAPANKPQSSKVTITATSVADPTVSQNVVVTLASPPPPPPTVTLALSGATTVTLGTSSQYAAAVSGTTNTGVTWSVNGVVGGYTTVGTISANGRYAAPANKPQSSKVTITATSVADPTVSQSLVVTLASPPPPPPTVTLALSGATTVTLGTSSQYAATVSGTTNTGVTWSVNGVVGGYTTVGTISANGRYAAPANKPQSSKVTITATSVADPTVSQSLVVTLASPPPPPPTVTLALSGATTVTLGTSSQYAATVSGTTNTGVTWSVNGVVGGYTTVGTISANGRYAAPANKPQSSKVTITATSVADPTVSQNLIVTLASPTPPPPTVTLALSGATTVTLGTSSQYAAIVSGTTNTGVTWTVNGVVGGYTAAGTISANGRYAAPANKPQSSKVTITATSVADPTVSQNVVVTLASPPPPPPTVTLALSGATTVTLGTSSQYAAAVSGTTNTGVTWSVNGVVGGYTTVGTISANGRYAAPANKPQSSNVTIAATSMADPTVSQNLVVTLASPPPPPPPVTLALSGATTVTLGTSSQYAAVVTGSSDISVTWSVNGVVGGDAAVGTITTQGRYSAPASMPQSSKVTITATSMADPSVSQNLTVTLATPVPQGGSVTVTLSGATSVELGTSSQYTAKVSGTTNTAVTWSVDGVTGGEASVGLISANGDYSAPASEPPSSTVTITATSVADPTVSQNLVITLTAPPPPPVVALTLSGATAVTLGKTSQYTATVTGSTNTSVIWTVNGITGGNVTVGSISASGLYLAPGSAPQPSTVTIAATSVADTSVAKSLLVSLETPPPTTRIPANAIASADINASSRWQWNHDGGTPGSSQGSTTYPVAGLSSDNAARAFYMTYSGHGGEIYHVSFATDKLATHFVYDANVYVADPSQLANLEMDMNDVTPDGKTMILGTQCSTYSKSWEYTLTAGGHPHWHPSNIPCDPMKWSANTWHHIQIASHRDNSGTATYDWVNVDGQYSDFQNASGPDALNLGWAIGDLLINFQIDGASRGSGSNTLYTDKLMVYRW